MGDKDVDMEEPPKAFLLDLPNELIWKIFTYLDAPTLLHRVSLVSKHLNLLVMNEINWKNRMRSTLSSFYPIEKTYTLNSKTRFKSGGEPTWRDLSYHIEREAFRWAKEPFAKTCNRPHFAEINVCRLLFGGRVCVSGGRDRLVVAWNLNFDYDTVSHSFDDKVHRGWVWGMTDYEGDSFVTSGWDKCVAFWRVVEGGICPSIVYNVVASAGCVDSGPGLVAVGLHNHSIALIDPRVMNQRPVLSRKVHKALVTDIKVVNSNVYSISEDRTLSIFDIRANASARENVMLMEEGIPLSLDVYANAMWIGNSDGYLTLIDCGQGFKSAQTFLLPEKPVSSVQASLGSVFAGFGSSAQIFTPTVPGLVHKNFELDAEVTSVSKLGTTVAVGTVNSLHIFKADYNSDTGATYWKEKGKLLQ